MLIITSAPSLFSHEEELHGQREEHVHSSPSNTVSVGNKGTIDVVRLLFFSQIMNHMFSRKADFLDIHCTATAGFQGIAKVTRTICKVNRNEETTYRANGM